MYILLRLVLGSFVTFHTKKTEIIVIFGLLKRESVSINVNPLYKVMNGILYRLLEECMMQIIELEKDLPSFHI